ncbi:MAG: hypothetical protein LBN23_05765 [Paludibacter sp.]|jgi:hypothetical protein|nr:hypothetical protein [Paludibacter sp.]
MSSKRDNPKIKQASKEICVKKSKIDELQYPVFCFKYLQDVSIRGSKDADFFVEYLFRLQKLSDLGWQEIRTSPKHSFGTENIPIRNLNPTKFPSLITPEVSHLTAFRATGNNRPFLGIQEGNVFHVIFIETKFGDIYTHS